MGTAKLVGVIGSGLIGTDPYEENAWSGSSKYFFRECNRQGFLARAFGVEVNNAIRIPLMLKNFSFDREMWRQRFYLDTAYYRQLGMAIVERLSEAEKTGPILQIGGIYDLKPLLAAGSRVYSYHDGNLAQALRSPFFSKGLPKRTIDAALAFERRVYSSVDRIFTMSEYLRKSFIEDFGVDEAKVHAIGAGVNLDEIPEAAEKKCDSKAIVIVGADFERKGGAQLLQAFRTVRRKHSDARLHIVGPRNLEIPPDASDGVVYHGFLSRRDPAQRAKFEAIMREASLFVLPSLYEPFGIAPLEAMLYEIPCVLSNAWAFPEMVTPGVNGALVDSGDVDRLAGTISDLLSDPDKLRTMGQAGRRRVLEKYTWRAVVERLAQILNPPPETLSHAADKLS